MPDVVPLTTIDAYTRRRRTFRALLSSGQRRGLLSVHYVRCDMSISQRSWLIMVEAQIGGLRCQAECWCWQHVHCAMKRQWAFRLNWLDHENETGSSCWKMMRCFFAVLSSLLVQCVYTWGMSWWYVLKGRPHHIEDWFTIVLLTHNTPIAVSRYQPAKIWSVDTDAKIHFCCVLHCLSVHRKNLTWLFLTQLSFKLRCTQQHMTPFMSQRQKVIKGQQHDFCLFKASVLQLPSLLCSWQRFFDRLHRP